MNEEKKRLDIAKPEIPGVEEARPPYDPEVEKKRLEVYESIQKGWQSVADKGLDTFNEILKTGGRKRLINLGFFLSVILVIFAATAFLAYKRVISGESFTFFVGTIVGFLFAYSLPRMQV